MNVEFIRSAMSAQDVPCDLFHFAFFGRSNCGKSSLLNGLAQRKSIARVSAQPGRTQAINVFKVNGVCYFMDLPGYGFAAAGKAIKRKWFALWQSYIDDASPKQFLFLIDIRRKLDNLDLEIVSALTMLRPPIIVQTKLDKVSRKEAVQQQKAITQQFQNSRVAIGDVWQISSLKKTNLDRLRETILDSVPQVQA